MAHLLHTSDTHLGYRQYHLDERRQNFADAFGEVISDAIEHDVDAVVHAGDLFHTSRPGITPLQTLLTELQRLKQADIPFLLIVGNHERTHDRNWAELLEEVGLATRLDTEGTRIADTTLYGLDFVPPGQRDRLDYQFAPPETDSAVLVGHGLFAPFPHADWDARQILAESPFDFDIMLVGDDHTPVHRLVGESASGAGDEDNRGEAEPDGKTGDAEIVPSDQERIPISYAGSTERTKADQRQPRTYSLVTVPSDGNVDPDDNIDRQEIQSVREFVYVDIPLRRGEGLDAVQESIREEVDDLDGAVLKVTLMAADEATPAPELETANSDDEESEPATHERIPVGPIENLGDELGALTTRVSDRRELLEDDREYETVEFADIDAAVEERRREMTVSQPADTLLEVALSTEKFVDSNMADTAEETVEELLEGNSPDAFHVDGEGRSEDEPTTSDAERDQPDGSDHQHTDVQALAEEMIEEIEE